MIRLAWVNVGDLQTFGRPESPDHGMNEMDANDGGGRRKIIFYIKMDTLKCWTVLRSQ